MKRLLVVAVGLAIAAAAGAQDRTRRADPVPPVQAPPSMNDPGTVTLPTPQAEAATAVQDATGAPPPDTALDANSPQPEERLPVDTHPLPPEVQAAAEASELPVITVRAQGAETVEEYRKRGKLYFVRVLSSSGPTRFYVDNPQAVPPNLMQQLSGPSGVVQPVYYRLADWK
jgi:hypothetical protein